ncbi:MAG: hypothetical protein COV59_02310 [Candidatus Magasanikbacteria bacterium CG11_big_fil_rev_8_21_14_0_20_39_34]|uniref:UDP-N-acetylmuramate:L-alanyl-gamma-D-glutamyl-meso-diaminopimelate ligase n=1 Tax=Candidatus Magasanikbacteria bacterium CG11_big_fil_rev_8_21_14_0_20_39_34 TaxID=1974653 RepID=A0A2H0N521_9BACT|nr:MAG: hypothetical protein COV59_02310 [Candidatus Magasanikbacteria bacterium CG11_big_fil_rev_8_21_14_0_20_39_34]
MKHIHFIGICGVAMSALATAFHKQGYKVTGSDKGFYPPVSDHLKNTGIPYYPGWHVEKMTEDGDPDLVIVGNVASSDNPEWMYVQIKGIRYLSYPEALSEFFIKDTSIVVSGTYGKTSTSALLSWTLQKLGADPSYMFGGLVDTLDSAYIGKSNLSVMEGDEYKSARWDEKAKFFHYKPTHLVLTALEWDHADIYKTEQAYFEAFEQLITLLPEEGSLVYNADDPNVERLSKNFSGVKVSYGSKNADYTYTNLQAEKSGLTFSIVHKNFTQKISLPLLGEYMAPNITACFALCNRQGFEPESITHAIQNFPGIKRRLEKRYVGDITIIDDIAHSPAKARNTLQTLRNICNGKIFAVFEPNTGNRQVESINSYTNAFGEADEVIIPKLTKIKIDKTASAPPMNEKKLTEVISHSHNNVICIDNDQLLIDHLFSKAEKDDTIVFLGSHGFRGMIEELIKKYD